jgi:hypothetical protein
MFQDSGGKFNITNPGNYPSVAFTINTSGNVGLGTTSPSYRLQLGTAGSLTDSIRIGSYLVASNTRQYIGYARADTGLFESSGNGDSPSSVLAGVAGIRIVNTVGTIASSQADNSVQLLTHIYNGNSRVALHAHYDGNVGIGTTSPAATLSVVGKTNLGNQASGFYVTPSTLHIASSTVAQISFEDYVVTAAIAIANNTFAFGHQNSSPSYEFKYSNTYNGNYASTGTTFVRFNPTTNYISSGNVGIGTTSPSFRLDIQGGLANFGQTASNGSAFRWGSLGTAVSPDTMLCMNQLWNGSGWTILNSSYGTTAINLGSAEASPTIRFETGGANTQATTKMIILNNGNVGIGTTSPAYKLDVAVASTADAIRVQQGGSSRVLLSGDGVISWGPSANTGVLTWDTGYAKVNAQSTNDLQLTTSGGGLLIVKSGGNVGIGTTSPSAKLDVRGNSLFYNSSADTYLRIQGNSSYDPVLELKSDQGGIASEGFQMWYVNNVGDVHFATTYNNDAASMHFYTRTGGDKSTSNERLTILGGGNVGIGTTSPGSLLHVNGRSYIGTMTAYAPAVHIRGAYYGGPRLQVYGLDADANAWMGLGTDMDGGAYSLSVYYPTNAASAVVFGKYDGTASQFGGFTATARLSNAGTWTVAGDVVAYGSPSDITLKTNIKPIQGALEIITKLQGVSFTWKEDTEMSKMTNLKDDIGFIAQEVQKIIPDLVRKNDNGLLSLRDKGITALLVEAIKEQQRQIDELKYLLQNK